MNERSNTLDLLAKAVEQSLTNIYGKKVGFALFMFEFGSKKAGDYISNANREDMIKFMRDLANRLESNDGIIGKTIGEA
jgi:hypothetical protein